MSVKKTRVLFLGPVPPPYMGPSLATEIILNSKLANTFDLIHMDTTHHEDLAKLGSLSFSNFLFAFRHYVLLIKLLVTKKPDIVYIPNCQTTVGYLRDSLLIVISKLFFKKVVCHLRGGNFRNWYNGTFPFIRFYVRRIHGLVDIQIVLGENLRALYDDIVAKDKIYVVPNGRDFDWPETSTYTTGKDELTKVLFLSNFMESKGILDVLRSIPEVIKKTNNVHFYFAGAWRDEHVKKELLETVKNHPEYPITIVGKISGDEKFKLINSASIFVMPTFYPPEGHPWSIVEAMAAGLPVISTDHAAIVESVEHGVSGYIVAKHAPMEVADKIATLCTDKKLCRTMAEASRKKYEKEFTENRMVERMTLALNASVQN